MTKAIRFEKTGGPEVLELQDIELPPLKPGEARVRHTAIGVNFIDIYHRKGLYKGQLPLTLGQEGAGTVEAIGPGVTEVQVGDRVVYASVQGSHAEQAIVPASSLIAIPDWLEIKEAAAVWMANFTAMGIIEVGKAGLGDFVIIPAASSSVGIAAMQLANWAGAEPIAATRTSAKADALRGLGAKHVIATQEMDVPAEVKRITGGKGVRLVFDPVGGPYVMTWAECMAERGVLFQYGGLSGEPTPYPHWPAAFKSLSVRGWVASFIWNKPHRYARAHQLILQGFASGHLKPVIAKTFPLAQIADAYRYLESNQQLGKIVVTVN